jgi:hypothetical protein
MDITRNIFVFIFLFNSNSDVDTYGYEYKYGFLDSNVDSRVSNMELVRYPSVTIFFVE